MGILLTFDGWRSDAVAAEIDAELRGRLLALVEDLPDCDPPSDAAARSEFHAADMPGYDDQTRSVTVAVLLCSRAAYNTTSVVAIADQRGIELAALPRLTVDATYASANDDTVLRALRVTGIGASFYAAGADFDPTTGMLTSYQGLRGLGDAFVSTTWRLGGEGFILETHDVDLTYNEKQDPMRVLEQGRIIEARPAGSRE